MVGTANLAPGDLVRIARAPLLRMLIDVFKRTDSDLALFQSTDVSEVEAVLEPSLTAAAATASPSPALLESLTRNNVLRSCASGIVCRRICAT